MSSQKKSDLEKKSSDSGKSSASSGPKKNKFTYVLSIIILVIITVAFVFTGNSFASNSGQSTGNISFGSYNGKEVIYSQGNYFARQFEQFANQLKSSGNDAAAVQKYAMQAAYNNAVLHTALLDEADRQAYGVSEDKIREEMKKNPSFADESGQFSKAVYKELKKNQPLEVKNIETLVRDEIKTNRIKDAYMTAARLNSKESAFLTSISDWERSFKYISFTSADYPDSEVLSYVTANAAKFTARDFSLITVEKKETADKAKQDIAAGTVKFEDYAKEHSLDAWASQGGKHANVYSYALALELIEPAKAETLMALKTGEISEPVQVPSGYAVFRADSDAKVPDAANPETVKKGRSYLTKYESGTIQTYIENLAKTVALQASGKNLDDVAKAAGKTVETTSSFPINYGGLSLPYYGSRFPILAPVSTADNKAISDAQTRAEFFTQAFKLKTGEISAPIVLADQVLILTLDTEKTQSDNKMFGNFASSLFQYMIDSDISERFVKKDKLKDNFEAAYSSIVTR